MDDNSFDLQLRILFLLFCFAGVKQCKHPKAFVAVVTVVIMKLADWVPLSSSFIIHVVWLTEHSFRIGVQIKGALPTFNVLCPRWKEEMCKGDLKRENLN
jgi:hypothetical protein